MDIAFLGVGVDGSDLKTGEAQLDSFARKGEQTERRIERSAGDMSKAMRGTAASTRSLSRAFNRPEFRGVSVQLSQVAQQAAATGDPMRALAIQAADIGLLFGGIGIAAGTAITALAPMALAFFENADGAEGLSDALEELDTVSSRLSQPLDILQMSVSDLAKEYRVASERVREFATLQAELRIAAAQADLEKQAGFIRDQASAYFTVVDASRNYINTLNRIRRDFGLTDDAARKFEEALTTLATGTTFSEQQAALQNISRLFREQGVEAANIPPEIARALDEAITYSNEVDRSRALLETLKGLVEDVADGTGRAASQAARLAENLALSRRIDGLTGGNVDYFDPRNEANLSGVVLRDRRSPQKTRQDASKRGGANAATLQFERERIRILNSLKTAQDKYNDSASIAERLFKAGSLSQEQYNQHLSNLQSELNSVKFEGVYRVIDSLSESLAEAIVTGESLGETMGSVFKQIAADLVSSGISSLLRQTFTGGAATGGGFLGSFLAGFGGFRADGGPVSAGTTYMVGERGPELFTPRMSGQITPNHQLGNGSSEIIVRHEPGTVVEIAGEAAYRVVRQEAPGIARAGSELALNEIRDSKTSIGF